MLIDSPYTKLKQRKDSLLHLGYNYKDNIMKKTMSNDITSSNTVLSTFVQYLNNIVYELVENVKQIKSFASFSMDKNERRIN